MSRGERAKLVGPFNAAATCPKCGHNKVNTWHCDGADTDIRSCWPVEREHLHRCCERCKFEWLESVIVAPGGPRRPGVGVRKESSGENHP
jgi:hypothetical protein